MQSLSPISTRLVKLGVSLSVMGIIFCRTASMAENLAGLNVGDKAPPFDLKNQTGEFVKLTGLLQKGPVAVVFYRSADWCPFCQKHLVALQEGLTEIKAAGLQLVGISYDPVEALDRFAKKRGIAFAMLSDPGSETIKAWKLLNAEAKGKGEGIPHPMTYIVDPTGVIRAKLGHEGYQLRHSAQELIEAAKPLTQKTKP